MSKFFIKRPIVAMVIAILTVIVGAVTIVSLPIAQFPTIAPPEIQLQANYPGADAKTLEDAVAVPIDPVTLSTHMRFVFKSFSPRKWSTFTSMPGGTSRCTVCSNCSFKASSSLRSANSRQRNARLPVRVIRILPLTLPSGCISIYAMRIWLLD